MKLGKLMRRMHSFWQSMSTAQKSVCVAALLFLIIGGVAGGAIGRACGEHRIKKQWEKADAIASEKHKQEIEELEEKIAKLQTQLRQEQNAPTIADLPWNLTLVNENYPMKRNYVPELTEIEEGYSVDSRIADPLRKMLAAAESEGMNIVFCSAYRSVERQEQVFNESMRKRVEEGMNYWEAYQETSESVAIPGTSEHGLGLAVDLISNQYTELDEEQANTKEAKWLKENCHRFGFILRYPPEKTEETGIIFEPWHYRYVGVEDATKIMQQGVTLETYLREYQ